MQLEHLKNFGTAVFPSGNNVLTELSCHSGSWGFQQARRGPEHSQDTAGYSLPWADTATICQHLSGPVLDDQVGQKIYKTLEIAVMTEREWQQNLSPSLLDGDRIHKSRPTCTGRKLSLKHAGLC